MEYFRRDKTFYDNEYLLNNPAWDVEDSPWKAEHIIKMIERHSLTSNIKKVCEVGCGAGEILNQLHARMASDILFEGYEISSQAFSLCKQREKERLNYYCEDFIESSKFYDLVLCMDVIEHVEDYLGFLRKIRGKAEYKLFHIPLDITVVSTVRNSLLNARIKVGHLHYFTKATALACLIDTGYEIVDSCYTSGSIDLPSKSVKTWLARFPRKLLFELNKDIAVRFLSGFSLLVLAK